MTKKEISYGIIPLRRENKHFKVFLICHQAGHWGFPKGHLEKNEEPKRTAARELKEETGLEILSFFSVDPLFEQYFFTKGDEKIQKTVTYYLAEVIGDISLQQEEIYDGAWFSLEEAEKKVTFPQAKKICFEVQKIIASLLILD